MLQHSQRRQGSPPMPPAVWLRCKDVPRHEECEPRYCVQPKSIVPGLCCDLNHSAAFKPTPYWMLHMIIIVAFFEYVSHTHSLVITTTNQALSLCLQTGKCPRGDNCNMTHNVSVGYYAIRSSSARSSSTAGKPWGMSRCCDASGI